MESCPAPATAGERRDRFSLLGLRAVARIGTLAVLLPLAGCSEVEFYWQGLAGQADLLARARPIPEVTRDTPDPALKAKLARIQEMRAFASRELSLPDNPSYTRYADVGRSYVVWNVFAAPELSLSPRQWCFPVAGCVAYRGYFSEADARAEAARLAAEGYDVHVGGVPAYSTLGYFDDPMLSTFIRYRDAEVARLVFHELAHQVVYVKDDSSFNESFAVAVEEAGLARWQAAQAGGADAAQFAADVARMQRLRTEFRTMIRTARDRLAVLYATDLPDAEKRVQKAAIFADMRADHERIKAGWGGGRGLRSLVRRRGQQCGDRLGRPLCRPGAAIRRASRSGRRRFAAVLRAGQGAGSPAEGGARRGAGGSGRQRCGIDANCGFAAQLTPTPRTQSLDLSEILVHNYRFPCLTRADGEATRRPAYRGRPTAHKERSACVTTKWFLSCILIRASRCPR